MRGTAFLIGAFLAAATGFATAAEVRVISVGSVQVAAKAIAADFNKATGHNVTLTVMTPSQIPRRLAAEPFDMLIASVGAMGDHEKSGILRPGSRVPLARVGIGVIVREGAPVPDVSTPDGFKKALLAARSIVHGDASIPNQSGVVTMRILAKAGILDAVKAKGRSADLAEGFAMVAKGEVEMALFNTVELPAGVRLAGATPAALADHTYFETAVLAKGATPDAAQGFIAAMTAQSARKIWETALLEPYPYR
jgi:molybdate transport system substrate-binding protein